MQRYSLLLLVLTLVCGCATGPRVPEISGRCCSEAVAQTAPAISDYLVTAWPQTAHRQHVLPAMAAWTDQGGRSGTFRDLRGQPLALSFIYTRCTNPNKCARVARAMGALEAEVQAAGLGERVRLLLLTYDPEHDTPNVLSNYAQAQGVKADSALRLARMDSVGTRKLLDRLEAAVNFNDSGVNIHGIQLFLFDKQGRWVRTYKTLLWDNAAVLRDLQKLASEAP
jgi:cytochrome oxidase Cu insertion factor (SCO1/SenC/PrrC family)